MCVCLCVYLDRVCVFTLCWYVCLYLVCVCVCLSNVCVSGAFDDEDIIHVEGNVDPVRDMEIIHEELRLKDEELIAPIIDKLEKLAIRGGDKKLKPDYVSRVLYCERTSHIRPKREMLIVL